MCEILKWTEATEDKRRCISGVLRHIENELNTMYTLNHKKRDILFLTITLANLRRFL